LGPSNPEKCGFLRLPFWRPRYLTAFRKRCRAYALASSQRCVRVIFRDSLMRKRLANSRACSLHCAAKTGLVVTAENRYAAGCPVRARSHQTPERERVEFVALEIPVFSEGLRRNAPKDPIVKILEYKEMDPFFVKGEERRALSSSNSACVGLKRCDVWFTGVRLFILVTECCQSRKNKSVRRS
jgi:hypothetical protein